MSVLRPDSALRRRRSWLMVLGLGLLPGASLAALRANYEVSLRLDGKTQSTRSMAAVRSGVAIVSDFGRTEVRLVPTIEADGAYALEVSIASRPDSPAAIATPVARTFRGRLGTPLEFEAIFDAIRVGGAIVLHGALN